MALHPKKSVSFPPDLLSRAMQRAGENFSGYLQRLVEHDLAGGAPPNAMAPTIMVDLTRDLLGKLDAEEMARAMTGLDQRRELRGLLSAYIAERAEKPRSHKRV